MQTLAKISFKWPVALLTLGVIFTLIGGCAKQNPGPDQVWMQNMAFNPVTITVPVNTTITWINKDENTYTITSNDSGLFDSGPVIGGSSYSYKFTTAGTYPYHNTIAYPNMTGTVIVQ